MSSPADLSLRQAWDVPSRPRPIIIIGAGAIVRTSHLPAYRRLGLPVAGLFDVRIDTAVDLAKRFGVPTVHRTLTDACLAGKGGAVVFDVAVPGDQVLAVLRCLPEGAAVLIQKPMGDDLPAARQILEMCRERQLIAAMNFQLRFSPNVLALRDLLERRLLGEIVDIEVRLQVRQPWETWAFMRGLPRLEVLYHSIHYLDTIRMLIGEPRGVYCRAVGHPKLPDYADPRSSIILDYGDSIRCSLTLNHTHVFGEKYRTSMLKIEGTNSAALASMGVNLDYPHGLPDTLEVAHEGQWYPVALRGSWFTEAFEGPMSNLQRFVTGEDAALVSPVDDAIRTMAVVEACYISSAGGGTPIPEP
ncbi:MAG TPA: Gfo/Idh/MocA family oxidoreductase [Vicinamibacterales bacterium]|nr:Gfo/Idh/MocA family oxidoreductase [Vicinamibacterales bacterium]